MELSLEQEKIEIPEKLPILTLRDAVAFPSIFIPIAIKLPQNIKLVDDALNKDKLIGLFLQKGMDEFPDEDSIYRFGIVAKITRMFRLPDGSLRIIVLGFERIKITKIVQSEPYYIASVKPVDEIVEKDMEMDALVMDTTKLYQELSKLSPYLPEELSAVVMNIDDPSKLADFIAAYMKIETEQKQDLLETVNVKERLKKLISILTKELDILKLGEEIRSKIKNEMDKAQKEFFLREQL